MSRRRLVGGAPVAAPFAPRHERRAPLLEAAFWRIAPGALAAVRVMLSFSAGGRR